MTTTITGSTITFTDGSTWAGANGTLTVDGNSATTATSYNVGYLAFANTVFTAGGGFNGSGVLSWGLNRPNPSHAFADYNSAGTVAVNTTAASNAYLGSQSFYIGNNQGGAGFCAGTWRGRGHAMNTGLFQYLGNFVLLERVA